MNNLLEFESLDDMVITYRNASRLLIESELLDLNELPSQENINLVLSNYSDSYINKNGLIATVHYVFGKK